MKNKMLILTMAFTLIVSAAYAIADDIESCRANYEKTKLTIQELKKDAYSVYVSLASDRKKNFIEECSAKILSYLTNNIFPAWYGTKWSFNGNSIIPGKDSIACGFYVIQTLNDAGFNVPRKMALQPSENIIKNLVDHSRIKKFSNRAPMNKIREWIQSQGHGLFLVGLDQHVGFIIYTNKTVTFCHSNYYDPPLAVENKEIISRSPLTDSKYRVMAKLLDEEMIEKWIKGYKFEIEYDFFKDRGR